jgi:hypothetical protein
MDLNRFRRLTEDILELQPSEQVANLFGKTEEDALNTLQTAGYEEMKDLSQEFSRGKVFVFRLKIGGDGITEIPYVYVAIEDGEVTNTATSPTPNESLEVLKVNISKMAKQASF